MREKARLRYRQNRGFVAGSLLGLALIGVLSLPGQERLHIKGPPNTGHERLSCQSCHKSAPGTMRQQLQANVRYVLGLRASPVDFGRLDVDNFVCLSCHERPNDNHPVFRFMEPRFEEAREKIRPHICVSCHLEHTGRRVTTEPTICVNCHRDLKVKNDTITISHESLIAEENWLSCLGCHDWHGNHVMTLNTKVAEAIAPERVREYFAGGPSPYSDVKFYPAKEESIQ